MIGFVCAADYVEADYVFLSSYAYRGEKKDICNLANKVSVIDVTLCRFHP